MITPRVLSGHQSTNQPAEIFRPLKVSRFSQEEQAERYETERYLKSTPLCTMETAHLTLLLSLKGLLQYMFIHLHGRFIAAWLPNGFCSPHLPNNHSTGPTFHSSSASEKTSLSSPSSPSSPASSSSPSSTAAPLAFLRSLTETPPFLEPCLFTRCSIGQPSSHPAL